METLNLNKLLNREVKANFIKEILTNFELNKNNLSFKKGIYIYGDPGSGKTTFVTNILKELNYDIIKYDAGDIRNKSVIDEITKHNMSDKNIMSIFNKKIKKIAIIMDEIDGMNNGDKGGINTLIKLIRPKKTKKQKLEEITMNPIVCIGNYKVDKKIKELMKVCNIIELNTPNTAQMISILKIILPNISEDVQNKITNYVQCDLRKLTNIYNIYVNNPSVISSNVIENIFQLKSYNDDTKKITYKLLNNYCSIENHNNIMNDTDRTSVGLLWHENIIDSIEKMDKKISIPLYLNQLDNVCFADYIDRITFQKQIWQFNEMSSLIKTFKNNKIYHEYLKNNKDKIYTSNKQHNFKKQKELSSSDVRFTKVLTKYSTEYNNSIFIQNLCQQLSMDKKDLFGFFISIKNIYDDNQIYNLFENYEINKLDINRMYRYLDKYMKEDAADIVDKEHEIYIECDIDCDDDMGFDM
jgi:DNA polymerase III delta prime subunit